METISTSSYSLENQSTKKAVAILFYQPYPLTYNVHVVKKRIIGCQCLKLYANEIIDFKNGFHLIDKALSFYRFIYKQIGYTGLREDFCFAFFGGGTPLEKPICHLSRLHNLSFIKIRCYVCMKLSVGVRTTQVSGYFINVECQ